MNQIKKHLFICTSCTYKNQSGDESSPEESVMLRRNLKNRIRESEYKQTVKVSAVTCLGECEHGIAAVLYPKGQWLLGSRPKDEQTLFEMLTTENPLKPE
jgi:predicted metal-binding protein